MPDRKCSECDRQVGSKGARGRCPRCYKRLQAEHGGKLPKQHQNIDARYPSEQAMAEILDRVGSYTRLAAEVGVSRLSLHDYLKIRPELKARLDQHQRTVHKARRFETPGLSYQALLARNRAYAEHRRRGLRERPELLAQETVEYIEVLRGDPCSYCGTPPTRAVHIDHIEPLSRDGSPTWENLTSSCASCNPSKNDRPMLIWMLQTIEQRHERFLRQRET